MLDKDLQTVSNNKILEGVRTYGQQKSLAIELNMSDTELSRLINDQAPKFVRLLTVLNLQVVDADLVDNLRKVLKEVL